MMTNNKMTMEIKFKNTRSAILALLTRGNWQMFSDFMFLCSLYLDVFNFWKENSSQLTLV